MSQADLMAMRSISMPCITRKECKTATESASELEGVFNLVTFQLQGEEI